MPALPPFAPWIKAPDETGNYAAGFQLAASAAHQAAALAAQKEEAAQRMELAKQTQQQNLLMDQQRMAITKQYHEQQASINQQRAKAYAAKMQEDTLAKARQYAAQQQFDRDRAQLMASGLDETTATARAALKNYSGMGIPGTSIPNLAKYAKGPEQAFTPRSFTDASGVQFAQTAPDKWQSHFPGKAAPTPADEVRKRKEDILKSAIIRLETEAGIATKEEVKKSIEQRIEEKNRQLDALGGSSGKGGGDLDYVLDPTTGTYVPNRKGPATIPEFLQQGVPVNPEAGAINDQWSRVASQFGQ